MTLGILALLAAVFIYFEFNNYYTYQNKAVDNEKLLRTNTLLTTIYEAENLSKLALRTRKRNDLKAYSLKVDSVGTIIDTLKEISASEAQIVRLDSIQKLLLQKVFNNSELRKIKVRNASNAPMDSLLQGMNDIEADMGRITPQSLVPNFDSLTPAAKKSISAYVAFLNKNVPKDAAKVDDGSEIDSIFHRSKNLIATAQKTHAKMERSMIAKELQIYRSDLALSQKLRGLMTHFEQEIALNNALDTYQKERVLKRSIALTAVAVGLGLVVVSLFTFLIAKDFWKIQQYRYQLEKEKKYSESLLKSREQLISTVSHDLKTPLHTIDGYTELLHESALSDQQSAYVKPIRSATTYITNLVDDLLDFSKLESGNIVPKKKPFVLSDVLEETATSIEKTNNKEEVELQLEISEALRSPIINDAFRMQQILSNLIGNAFKFTTQGHVKIMAAIEQKNGTQIVRIVVSDTGIGIKKEKQEAIFQEFTQANSMMEKKYGGYGLGLTISKKLTELLGGKLYVKSQENRGSTFTLELPLVFAPKAESINTTSSEAINNSLSVLIFDDDTTLLQLLKQLCQNSGIKVIAHSSFMLLKKEERVHYDVVLTDIQMPHVDGFEVVKKLKSGRYTHYKEQPVIGMTGQRDINKKDYVQAGFAQILQKPFSQAELANAFKTVLRQPTKIANNYAKTATISSSRTSLFDIEDITAFVDTPDGIRKILKTFVLNTSENMELLSIAVHAKSFDEIQHVSHRMLPMFRQLRVRKAIVILEQLERVKDDISTKKLKRNFKKLKNVTLELEEGIHSYLAIPLVDNN